MQTKKITSALLALVFILTGIMPAFAIQTVPHRFTYSGTLTDEYSNPITSAHTFRFSLWRTGDYLSTDVDAGGSINASAINFAGYAETQTVTPNRAGGFFVEVGSVNPLPDLAIADHAYLQVEVKPAGSADSAYVLLDPDLDLNSALDRKPLDSAPYAINADMLDNIEVGTGAGDLTILGENDTWSTGQIPGGTDSNIFVLDSNNAGGDVTLSFGTTLGKFLKYDSATAKFILNDGLLVDDSMAVTGNIYVDGLVDGRDIAADAITLEQSLVDIANLSSVLATAQADLAALANMVVAGDSALSNDIAVLSSSLDTAQAELTTLAATVATADAALAFDIATLVSNLSNTVSTLNTLVSDVTVLTNRTAVVESGLVVAESDITALSNSLATTTAEIVTLTSNLAATNTALTNLATTQATDKVALETVQAVLSSTLAAFGTDLIVLSDSVSATNAVLAADIAILSSSLTAAQTELTNLSGAVVAADAVLTADIVGLTADLNAVAGLLTAVEINIATLISRADGADADIATVNSMITALTQAVNATTASIATITNDLATLSSQQSATAVALTATQTSLTNFQNTQTATNTSTTTAITDLQTAQSAQSATISSLVSSAHTANTDTSTTANTFTLNSDDTVGNVSLSFGATLGRSLTYDSVGAKFVLNDGLFIDDSLAVSGSIYVDGLVDGRDIAIDGVTLDIAVSDLAVAQAGITDLVARQAVTDLALADLTAQITRDRIAASTLITWDYAPQAVSRQRYRKKNATSVGGENTGYVMTRPGQVLSIGVSTNPQDDGADGTFYITKNDNGRYDTAMVVTSVTLTGVGIGDSNNSVFTVAPTVGPATLSFQAGDILRVYHSDREQKSSRIILEVLYE